METVRVGGFDKGLFFITIILVIGGIVMVFSTSGVVASEKYQQPFHYQAQQLLGAVLGIGLMLGLVQVRLPFYRSKAFVYGLLAASGLLLLLCFAMPGIAQTQRWVFFRGLRFQPSELAKVSLVLFLAYTVDRKKDALRELRGLVSPLAVVLAFTLLILLEPDYGTGLLIFTNCVLILFVGGIRLKHLAVLGLSSAALFGLYLVQAPYRVQRILAFLFPGRDPLGAGFQVIQSKLAVGSGGLLGVSIGESTQKLFFLPCAHTDFLYAIIGEETGLVGALFVLVMFVLLIWRGIVIFRRAPGPAAQMTVLGLVLMIGTQALLNITIVLGLGPAKGIPLPLMSYGRSSLVMTLASIGIILNISQRRGKTDPYQP
ncbi:MAG: cell division protein FtsW [Candidatus Aminicenantes bacterium]|nr:cell division protein FtsW [Candidatus Aminicenantes bacterium]